MQGPRSRIRVCRLGQILLPFRRAQFAFLFITSLTILTPIVATSDDWRMCPHPLMPDSVSYRARTDLVPGQTEIEADLISAKSQDWLQLDGNVIFRRGLAEIQADKAHYSLADNRLNAEGSVRLSTPQLTTVGKRAEVQMGDNVGRIDQAQFWMEKSHLRGFAEEIRFQSANRTSLTESRFTSCVEGNTDWELRASTLEIDTEKNEGVATHARLSFQNVPIFYFPYLSFPLLGRKTGLLLPEWGDSTKTGRYLSLPYYINISPNRDATLTPRYFQKRGTMLDSQYRYLQPKSNGQLDLAYLREDRIALLERYYGKYHLLARPSPGWVAEVDYRKVSDTNYFSDFGDSYVDASTTHLAQTASIGYHRGDWRGSALLQNYQTVDEAILPTDQPYQRVPELQLSLLERPSLWGFSYAVDTEFTEYQRMAGLVGRRLDIAPSMSLPIQGDAGYIKPKATFRHTRYQLDRQLPSLTAQPDRTISQWSLDSGLYLEKVTQTRGDRYVQTLEPRLFYLYVPYRDQAGTLLDSTGKEVSFDSGVPEQSYTQLFRDNRFTGLDRIGDSNQLTMAMTTRFLSPSGLERLHLSAGQIYYFKPLRLGAPNAVAPDSNRSNLIVEFSSRWTSRWSMRGSYAWRPTEDSSESGLFRFYYRGDRDTMYGLNYRYQRQESEQTDASVVSRLTAQWKGVAHLRYSLRTGETLEHYEGVEYQSCCWSFRILRREYLTEDAKTDNKSIWIQLELKGLTEVGQKLNDVFTTGSLSDWH